jgi:hypothetical protein
MSSTSVPAAVQAAIDQAVAAATKKADPAFKYDKPAVDRHPLPRIMIPEKMPYDTAIDWISKAAAEETKKVRIFHEISCFPTDGLLCFWKALVDTCGFAVNAGTPSFFGTKPPIMVAVRTGPNPDDSVNVPYGRMETPAYTGFLETTFKIEPGKMPSLIISGEVLSRERAAIDFIVAETRRLLASSSIYKGRAIRMSFDFLSSENGFDFASDAPLFMDVSKTEPDSLILPRPVQDALNIGLFACIQRTEAFRLNKIPRKGGVLLEGHYGTGKTMTAEVTARLCVDNGWTFLYVSDVAQLPDALRMAATLAPCVLFAEDLDRVTSGDRDAKIDEILNTIDGVDYKHKEILCVFTTNDVRSINPAMIRPGRIDSVVQFTPPDAETAIRLVQRYAQNLLDPSSDLTEAGEILAGMIPASIRAVVEKAKIATLLRAGVLSKNVTGDDVVAAAHSMRAHLAFVNRPEPTTATPLEIAAAQGQNGLRLLTASVEGLTSQVAALPTAILSAASN